MFGASVLWGVCHCLVGLTKAKILMSTALKKPPKQLLLFRPRIVCTTYSSAPGKRIKVQFLYPGCSWASDKGKRLADPPHPTIHIRIRILIRIRRPRQQTSDGRQDMGHSTQDTGLAAAAPSSPAS